MVGGSLSQIIINAESCGLFQGFEVGNDKVNVSYLQFAYDTLIITDGDCRSSHILSTPNRLFRISFWFKIKLGKSHLLGIALTGLECAKMVNTLDVLKKIGHLITWAYH